MKVDEMKTQRQRFGEQFREQVHTDDITNVLVTREEVNQEVGVCVYIINAVWHLIVLNENGHSVRNKQISAVNKHNEHCLYFVTYESTLYHFYAY